MRGNYKYTRIIFLWIDKDKRRFHTYMNFRVSTNPELVDWETIGFTYADHLKSLSGLVLERIKIQISFDAAADMRDANPDSRRAHVAVMTFRRYDGKFRTVTVFCDPPNGWKFDEGTTPVWDLGDALVQLGAGNSERGVSTAFTEFLGAYVGVDFNNR